jgi:GT2 family glycosyltransferase
MPTCARPAEAIDCLRRLVFRELGSEIFFTEFIVMDDGGSQALEDGIHSLCQCFETGELRIYPGPRRGPAANRNAGAKLARGEWLVFLDDDCVPDPGYLNGLVRFINDHSEIRAVEGRTYPDRPQRSLAERGPFNESGCCFYSCNIALRRDLFEEIGGFDEDYVFSLEDLDLYTRLVKLGEPTAFVPEASVMHPQKEALGWGFFWSMQRGRRTYLRKHPDQARSYSCEQMWKIWLHDVLFRLIPDAVRFRGRGLGRRLVYEGLALLAPLLLKLPDPPPFRS